MAFWKNYISVKCLKIAVTIFMVLMFVAYILVDKNVFPRIQFAQFAKIIEYPRLSFQFHEAKRTNNSVNYSNLSNSRNYSNLDTTQSKDYEIKQTKDPMLKSPYFVIPKNYTRNGTPMNSNTTRKLKIISCFNCPHWFIKGDAMSMFNRDFKACPNSQCVFNETAKMDTDDVVIFFVGALGKSKVPPRRPGQIWVKSYFESPIHYDYPTPYEPWKDVFNWTLNFRTDSDLFAPINRLRWRNDAPLSNDEYLSIANNKTKTAAWFVSNCRTQSRRDVYVKEMQKYIDIDIYGRCGTLSCTRSEVDSCERRLTTTYKFYLSFENSICKDYVTEKFYRLFMYRSHVIPVVRGGFDYNKYFPHGTFINSADFSSPRDLALYLKQLGDDHVSYARMLKEKDRFATVNYKIDWCEVCEKVHTDTGIKTIPDIRKWSHNGTCHRPSDINAV